jgi:hypothetical protein
MLDLIEQLDCFFIRLTSFSLVIFVPRIFFYMSVAFLLGRTYKKSTALEFCCSKPIRMLRYSKNKFPPKKIAKLTNCSHASTYYQLPSGNLVTSFPVPSIVIGMAFLPSPAEHRYVETDPSFVVAITLPAVYVAPYFFWKSWGPRHVCLLVQKRHQYNSQVSSLTGDLGASLEWISLKLQDRSLFL